MRAIAFIAFALAALAADARPRLVRRPAPEDAVHYRGDATRRGVLPSRGPRTFSRIAWQASTGPASFSPPVYAGSTLHVPNGEGRIVALDGATGATRWTSAVLGQFTSVPLVTPDAVYVGSESGHVRALDPATGAVLWSFAADHWVVGSPALHEGTLYFGTEGGTFYAVDAVTHAERWRFRGNAPTHASPVLAGGAVFFYASARLYALDAATGAERWHRDLEAGNWLALTYSDGRLFAAGAGGNLFALDPDDGDVLWQVTPPPNVSGWSFLGALNGMLFASNDAREVVAFEQATGRRLWTLPTAGIPTEPMIADAALYVGTDTGRVYAVESATGAQLWSADLTRNVSVAAAIGDGRVFFVASDGTVLALE